MLNKEERSPSSETSIVFSRPGRKLINSTLSLRQPSRQEEDLPPIPTAEKSKVFYILEGEITFTIGDSKFVATAGMFANMPVGVAHAFKNESDRPAKMLVTVAPAGLEKMFFEFGVPLAEGAVTAPPPTMEEIQKLLQIAPNYGIEILLPPR